LPGKERELTSWVYGAYFFHHRVTFHG
jgi:hypothetical protein